MARKQSSACSPASSGTCVVRRRCRAGPRRTSSRCAGRHLDAVAVGREGRADAWTGSDGARAIGPEQGFGPSIGARRAGCPRPGTKLAKARGERAQPARATSRARGQRRADHDDRGCTVTAALAAFLGLGLGGAARRAAEADRGAASAPTGSPRPSTAASTRPSPTAPTRSTASRSPSCRAARRPTTACCCRSAGSSSTWAATCSRRSPPSRRTSRRRGRGDFQKEPQVLMAHPGQGFDTFEDLKKSNDILVSKEGFATYYQWMKTRVRLQGRADEALHLQPGAVPRQQEVGAAGLPHLRAARGREGRRLQAEVFLLADHGFTTYSTTIETRREMVEKQPDVVQRFVDASTIGWYNYLYGDNKAANALIKKDNPEMTDEQIAFSIAKMKEYGIVDSGDAAEARHRLHDGRAHEGLLRQDGEGGPVQGRSRLQEGLHAAIREQGRRHGAEESERRAGPAGSVLASAGIQARSCRVEPACRAPGLAARRSQDLRQRHDRARRTRPRHPPGEFVSLLGPRAAASRRRCASSRASASRPPGAVDWPGAAGEDHRGEIGFVFQEPTLMPWANVADNVWLPLRLRGVSRRAAAPRASRRCLALVGLAGFAHAYPRELSGGMKMRVSIARALFTQAEAAPDGRALRGARRDHPLQAQRRPAAPAARTRLDGDLRHPFGLRVRLSVEPHRRDGGAARAGSSRRSRSTRHAAARRQLPHRARSMPISAGSASEALHGRASHRASVAEERDRRMAARDRTAAPRRPRGLRLEPRAQGRRCRSLVLRADALGAGKPMSRRNAGAALHPAGAERHLGDAHQRLAGALRRRSSSRSRPPSSGLLLAVVGGVALAVLLSQSRWSSTRSTPMPSSCR